MFRFSFASILVAALISAVGCSNTDSALTEPANAFLSAIADGDTARAHRYLSRSLGSRTSVEALETFMRHTGLSQPRERDWQVSSINGDIGIINGEVGIDGEPQPLPVQLTLVKEDIHWKIDGVARGVRIAGANGGQVLFAPADTDSSDLARQTMANFASAVARDDLRGYWSTMAGVFRTQFSADQFDQAFAGFVRDRVNLGAAAKLSPRFTAPPSLEANGELVMRGVFPTQPSQTSFEYRFANEGGTWRNSGITLRLVPRN